MYACVRVCVLKSQAYPLITRLLAELFIFQVFNDLLSGRSILYIDTQRKGIYLRLIPCKLVMSIHCILYIILCNRGEL